MKALKTLPAATVVVAISSSHGPGSDMQMGLVPTRPSLPCHGGTIGEALHTTMPIMPAALIFCAHQAAAPKWLDSRATTMPSPCARASRIACAQQVSAIHWPTPFWPSSSTQAPDSETTRPSAAGSISPASSWST